MTDIEAVEFSKADYSKSDEAKLWFANVALLHDTILDKVLDELPTINLTNPDMVKLIAINSLYLKSDLELIAFRVTPLIRNALQKRLNFIRKLSTSYSVTRTFYRSDFISDLETVSQMLRDLVSTKFPSEYYDSDESLKSPLTKCVIYLEALLFDMKQNYWLNRWLSSNGYDKCEISILYHSFLIPIIPLIYAKQFSRKDDETVVEKIEYYCFCKMDLSEKVPVLYQNQFYLIECLFDPFRGRYLGMLDMINYISKLITPMRYEFKHLTTLAKVCDKAGKESIESFNKDVSMKLMKPNNS